MKILHTADTHLGYSAYRKVTEEGINQREQDTYNSFKQFIDYAIENQPDYIIHAGDLFDSVRPNNRAITFAVNQILRLSKQNIPFIIIAGNHEHPKLKETGHIFSVFEHIEHVHPVYHGVYEKKLFKKNNKKTVFHLIPQSNLKEEYEKEIKKLKPDSEADYNIVVSHGAVKGIKAFSMNELNELFIPADFLSKDFDYIALGHYHTYTRLNERSYYSGSTEKLSFTEAEDQKGFIEVNLDKKIPDANFVKIENREMINLEEINCENLEIDEIMKKIKQKIQKIQPKEKIFRLNLQRIPYHIYRAIDFSEIKKISNQAVHSEIKTEIIRDDLKNQNINPKIDPLTNEFQAYILNQNLEHGEDLLKTGLNYIQKIEEKNET
jgi:DNA repair protein SbcD/Mre11